MRSTVTSAAGETSAALPRLLDSLNTFRGAMVAARVAAEQANAMKIVAHHILACATVSRA